ncbi:hypothetical protein Leryth_011092 [Lithospermum erythrorhizon]|nr:hypothetical protein Leryth_011092 [Lithospermum erythrorhizon]
MARNSKQVHSIIEALVKSQRKDESCRPKAVNKPEIEQNVNLKSLVRHGGAQEGVNNQSRRYSS